MAIKQRTPMTYLRRTGEAQRAAYGLGSSLPPRAVFEGFPDVLAAHDEFTRLQAAMRDNERQALEKNRAADAADETHSEAVKDALRTGADPAKVKNPADRLRAEAKAHLAYASEAKAELTNASHRLGRLIQDAGTATFQPSEQTITEAAEDITVAVDSLRSAWARWGEAMGVRLHLAHVVALGGIGMNYSAKGIPPEIAEALRTVSTTLDNLDKIKADEAQLAEWRETERRAIASNMAMPAEASA